jgi:hypothetical protein
MAVGIWAEISTRVPPEQDADMLAVVTLSQRMLEIVLGQILA